MTRKNPNNKKFINNKLDSLRNLQTKLNNLHNERFDIEFFLSQADYILLNKS